MIIVAILLALLLAVVLSVPAAWIVMLLLGVAHSLEPSIPALGFWVTLVLVIALRVAVLPSDVDVD